MFHHTFSTYNSNNFNLELLFFFLTQIIFSIIFLALRYMHDIFRTDILALEEDPGL